MHTPTASSTRRKAGTAAVAGVLTSLALAAAGCGGSPPASGVANIGATTTAASDPQPSTTSGSGKADDGRAFSVCMRANGVPNFPDPSKGGGLTINGGSGLNPDSPQFKTAETKCRKLLPNGGKPTAAQQAKMQADALAYSACMRTHGVPKFPDPEFSAGGSKLTLGRGSGIDPASPAFKAAQTACASKLPGLKGGADSGPSGKQSGSGPSTGSTVQP